MCESFCGTKLEGAKSLDKRSHPPAQDTCLQGLFLTSLSSQRGQWSERHLDSLREHCDLVWEGKGLLKSPGLWERKDKEEMLFTVLLLNFDHQELSGRVHPRPRSANQDLHFHQFSAHHSVKGTGLRHPDETYLSQEIHSSFWIFFTQKYNFRGASIMKLIELRNSRLA